MAFNAFRDKTPLLLILTLLAMVARVAFGILVIAASIKILWS